MSEPILTVGDRNELLTMWSDRTVWLMLCFTGHYRRDLIPEHARMSRFAEWTVRRRRDTLRRIADQHPDVFDAAASGVGRVQNMLVGAGS